jgi:cytochrome b561
MVPRLALRLTSRIPRAVPGNQLEQGAAKFTHYVMYFLAIGMPAS